MPDHFPLTLSLQSVYSREVDEEELEVEGALRERDERIRELEMVIMKQVGKLLHFFRPQLRNPLSMLSFCIVGIFPIGARLEHLHGIGSIDG